MENITNEDHVIEMAHELRSLGPPEYGQYRSVIQARWGGDYSDELFQQAEDLAYELDAETPRDVYVIGSYPGAVGWYTEIDASESLQDAARRLAESAGCDSYTVEDPGTGEAATWVNSTP